MVSKTQQLCYITIVYNENVYPYGITYIRRRSQGTWLPELGQMVLASESSEMLVGIANCQWIYFNSLV